MLLQTLVLSYSLLRALSMILMDFEFDGRNEEWAERVIYILTSLPIPLFFTTYLVFIHFECIFSPLLLSLDCPFFWFGVVCIADSDLLDIHCECGTASFGYVL